MAYIRVYIRIYGHISFPSRVRAPAGAFFPAKKLPLANLRPAGFFSAKKHSPWIICAPQGLFFFG